MKKIKRSPQFELIKAQNPDGLTKACRKMCKIEKVGKRKVKTHCRCVRKVKTN